LAQYYPHIVYFEEVGGEVVASGFGSSFPLLRYRFHDSGGVIPYESMLTKLKNLGVDINKEARKANIFNTIFKLPFVYVYARSDFVVILRGANIYPENVKSALLDKGITNFVTGKFCMLKRENRKFEEFLEVNVELKKGVKKTAGIVADVALVILETLRRKNSEFNYLYMTEGKKLLTPKVFLYPYEHPKYFKQGIKQTWVKH
jgi:phenylacetate-CoA ligase